MYTAVCTYDADPASSPLRCVETREYTMKVEKRQR